MMIRCPRCGSELESIIEDGHGVVDITWEFRYDEKTGRYFQYSSRLGDMSEIHHEHYHCPYCYCELPEELVKNFIER